MLTDVDMVVPRGQVVAIMGLSGSGKTTILRLIGGQVKPNRGTVSVARSTNPSSFHTAISTSCAGAWACCFSSAPCSPTTRYSRTWLSLCASTRSLPEAFVRDLVLMKLHAVGLRGAAQLKPEELSGGMARRVALARAIALDPMLIMYDEPFTGLDPISTGVIANLIRRLNDALGATSILVTHDIQESFKIADYIYFISAGRVVAEGTPQALRDSTEPFVQQFVQGETDGPVPFQYSGDAYAKDLGLEAPK